MYTNSNYRPYNSSVSFLKSKSVDNFYRRATQKSLKYQSTIPTQGNECLACKHEQQKSALTTPRPQLGLKNIYTSGKNSAQQYYKTSQKDEIGQLRSTKRYLQQLLERSKSDHKRSIDVYQKRLAQLNRQLQEKSQALIELQKTHNRKEAENCYLANASLVRSYKQMNIQDDEEVEQNRTKKIKELLRKNTQLQEQLAVVRQSSEQKKQKLQALQLQMVQMREYQTCFKEYQAMKVLIDKMEQQKLQLLDRQHIRLQQLQSQHKEEIEEYLGKVGELKQLLDEKCFKLNESERQLNEIKANFTLYRNQQYETLRDLLEERDKECLKLESKLNCVESEFNFIKARYGYILKMAINGQLNESQAADDEYCIERIGRYQVSNGKESLISMNLSPIKKK